MIKIVAYSYTDETPCNELGPYVFIKKYKTPKTAAAALKHRCPLELDNIIHTTDGITKNQYIPFYVSQFKIFDVFRIVYDDGELDHTDYYIYEEPEVIA